MILSFDTAVRFPSFFFFFIKATFSNTLAEGTFRFTSLKANVQMKSVPIILASYSELLANNMNF